MQGWAGIWEGAGGGVQPWVDGGDGGELLAGYPLSLGEGWVLAGVGMGK